MLIPLFPLSFYPNPSNPAFHPGLLFPVPALFQSSILCSRVPSLAPEFHPLLQSSMPCSRVPSLAPEFHPLLQSSIPCSRVPPPLDPSIPLYRLAESFHLPLFTYASVSPDCFPLIHLSSSPRLLGSRGEGAPSDGWGSSSLLVGGEGGSF
jgi:hypothetical protein